MFSLMHRQMETKTRTRKIVLRKVLISLAQSVLVCCDFFCLYPLQRIQSNVPR